MSARMLQRAVRNHHAQIPSVETPIAEGDLSDSEAEDHQGPLGNPFELLGSQDEKEDDDVDVERDANQQSAAGSASTSAPVPLRKSNRKKNKGKKKGKKESTAGRRQALGEEDADAKESLDALLEQLAVRNGEGASHTSGGLNAEKGILHSHGAGDGQAVLTVDTKRLRAEDELRRIFGSKVVNSVDNKLEGSGAHRRPLVGGRHARRGMPLRKSVLVVPKDHWARWDGGMSMDCIKVEGRLQYFRYEYSAAYQDVQKRFESCVASHDPNTILMLLRSHPYHVDSLLALAELYKQMGEHQQAANLMEQCLYALECAWHPSFNPSLGTCRLEFSWDTNRALFLLLSWHMQHLGRRGCHRTALEVCKLLLSLDPSDPLGALFRIDYFALRAQQYEWLERFIDEYKSDKFSPLLPNFSFSVAVLSFYLEEQRLGRGSSGGPNENEGSVGKKSSAAILLQQALMLHPSVLKKVIAKARIKEDHSWTKTCSHPHFAQDAVGGPTLEHLIDIYVEQNYLIWRSPELQGWLKDAATAVIEIADGDRTAEIANWECVRKEAFDSDENKYGYLRVSDFSDSISTLPPEYMPQLGLPAHGGFGQEGFEIPMEEGQLEEALHRAALQGRNALLVFLESMGPFMGRRVEASAEDAPALLDDGSDHNSDVD